MATNDFTAVEKIGADIEAFRKSLPPILKGDFDKLLRDLADEAKQDIKGPVAYETGKVAGGLIGGVVARIILAAADKGIDAGVASIEEEG